MKSSFSKWIWVELIGFDVQRPDYGVADYLSKIPFKIDGISLLIATPEFVNAHHDDFLSIRFIDEFCSYGAHKSNGERNRQVWYGRDLKGLITEFHRNHIPVYLSIFEFTQEKLFLDQHPELFYVESTGEATSRSLCPLKRFKDGSYYEDFFVRQLKKTLLDYDFDGYHAADGFAHPRYPVFAGDFSDDMIEQFSLWSKISLPETAKIKSIQKNYMSQWRDFYVWRQTGFWSKVVQNLEVINKDIIFNSTWTREPFEAIYRYGIDYQALYNIGIRNFVIEVADAGLELSHSGSQNPRPIYSSMARTLLLRGHLPEANFILMNQTRDFNERYLVLQHAFSLFEMQILAHFNLFYMNKNHLFTSCFNGALTCLGDGLSGDEWNKIHQIWQTGSKADQVQDISGITLILEPQVVYREIKQYETTREYYDYRLLAQLIAAQVPIHKVATLDHLAKLQGPLLILNKQYYEKSDWEKLKNYSAGPVVAINQNECTVINDPQATSIIPHKVPLEPDGEIQDSWTWLNDLYLSEKISDDYFSDCAKFLNAQLPPGIIHPAEAGVKFFLEKLPDCYCLAVFNDLPYYKYEKFIADREFKQLKYTGGFAHCDVEKDGDTIAVKLPPSGISIIELA